MSLQIDVDAVGSGSGRGSQSLEDLPSHRIFSDFGPLRFTQQLSGSSLFYVQAPDSLRPLLFCCIAWHLELVSFPYQRLGSQRMFWRRTRVGRSCGEDANEDVKVRCPPLRRVYALHVHFFPGYSTLGLSNSTRVTRRIIYINSTFRSTSPIVPTCCN